MYHRPDSAQTGERSEHGHVTPGVALVTLAFPATVALADWVGNLLADAVIGLGL